MIFDRKIVRRIAGVIPAQMFACGLAWMAADVMRLPYMRGEIFLASLITILLLNVILYNKVTKAVAALVFGVGAAVFIYLGLTGGIANELSLFAEEVAALLRSGAGSAELQFIVGCLLAVAAGIAAFCTAGGLRGAVVMALATLAAFCAAWYAGERSIFGCMALCASATAAVSAAGFGSRRVGDIERALEDEQEEDDGERDREVARRRRVSERGDDVDGGATAAAGKRRGARKAAPRRAQASAVGAVGSPAGIALFAIPLVILLAVVGTLFRPTEFARNLRVRAVEGAFDDAIDSIAQNIEGFSRRTTIFSLGAVGYGPAADLGGPVELLDDTTLTVEVNRPGYLHYLRGSVRSVYDGNGWKDGELAGSYRFESRLWDEQREDAFDILRGGMTEANSYFLTAYKRVGYAAQHASHFTSMFTLDRPETVQSRLYTPYFNLQGELFPKGRMEDGASYTVSGYAQQNMTKAVAQNLSRLVAKYAPEEGYERSDFENKIYEEFLPNGEVEITVAEGERTLTPAGGEGYSRGVYEDRDFGWVQSSKAIFASSPSVLGSYVLPELDEVLSDAKAWSTARAVDFYLFYGYTADDLALMEANGAAILRQQEWLDKYRDPQHHEELMAEYIETLEKPEPEAVWLTGAQMAVYGLDLGDRLWEMPVMEPEAENPFFSPRSMAQSITSGARYREIMREHVFVTSAGGSIRASEFLDKWSDTDTIIGMGLCAGANGFARLEYAGKTTYYPGVGEEFANNVALVYLAGLEDDGEANKFDMMLELAKALDASAEYTLEPMEVPDGVDFVDWFMSTNEGYCTYYATAMVVMARELGVPARYAEGYVLNNTSRMMDGWQLTNSYTLTGQDAHSWAEVWFDGVGWVTLDPLGLDALDAEILDDYTDVEVEPVRPSSAPVTEPLEIEPQPEDNGGMMLWAVALIAFGVVVVIAVFAFAMVRVLVVRSRALDRLRKKHGDKGAAKHLWTEILAALEMLEPLCVRGDGETASEFAERVKGLVFVEGTPFTEVASAAEVAWYAAREIREDELAKLDRCAVEMRRLMFRKAPLKVFWMVK